MERLFVSVQSVESAESRPWLWVSPQGNRFKSVADPPVSPRHAIRGKSFPKHPSYVNWQAWRLAHWLIFGPVALSHRASSSSHLSRWSQTSSLSSSSFHLGVRRSSQKVTQDRSVLSLSVNSKGGALPSVEFRYHTTCGHPRNYAIGVRKTNEGCSGPRMESFAYLRCPTDENVARY